MNEAQGLQQSQQQVGVMREQLGVIEEQLVAIQGQLNLQRCNSSSSNNIRR